MKEKDYCIFISYLVVLICYSFLLGSYLILHSYRFFFFFSFQLRYITQRVKHTNLMCRAQGILPYAYTSVLTSQVKI